MSAILSAAPPARSSKQLPTPFPYVMPPMGHQRTALQRSALASAFALFMEQGTGKTFVAINTAAALWFLGLIDAVIVIAPKGVHTNWALDEIPKWLPRDIPWRLIHWRTGRMTSDTQRAKTRVALFERQALLWCAINIDAVTHKAGKGLVTKILETRRTLLIIDESSDIANPTADRTKTVDRLATKAAYRRILNGTPGDPLKVWSQMHALDWRILGTRTFREHQLRYAAWEEVPRPDGALDPRTGERKVFLKQKRTRDGEKVWLRDDELRAKMAPYVFRITKDEALDLPPKLYSKSYCTLNAEQIALYRELVEDFYAEFPDGRGVTVQNMLSLYLRLQQIVCGYVPVDPLPDEVEQPIRRIAGPNHRIEALDAYIEHAGDTPGIIWSRFKLDIEDIRALLQKRGATFVEYHGGITSETARHEAKRAFQAGDVQWFVGNQRAGGRGLTLTAARLMCFYSNYFGLETRQQAEDRGHRIGTVSLTITDLVAERTIDEIILRAFRSGKHAADLVTGDLPTPWV